MNENDLMCACGNVISGGQLTSAGECDACSANPGPQPKIVWKDLHSKDPRKPGIVAALRALAGHPTSRVTMVQVRKDGTQARGRVLKVSPDQLFIVHVALTPTPTPQTTELVDVGGKAWAAAALGRPELAPPTLALDLNTLDIVHVAPTTTPVSDSPAQATTNEKEIPTMSTATKTLRNILKRMGVEVRKDADEDTTKKVFEAAVEAGKLPEQVSEAEAEVLKALGYEVEGAPVKKNGKTKRAEKRAARELEEAKAPTGEAKPAKVKKVKAEKPAKAPKAPKEAKKLTFATWFRAYWAELKTSTRDELYADFTKKFPDATEARGVQVVRFYIRDAKLQPKRWGFELAEGKDGKLTKGKGAKAKDDAGEPQAPGADGEE